MTFGLLILDLVGADHAGWFGERTASELALLVGLSLLAAALVWSTGQRQLAAPQLVAGIGLLTAYAAAVSLVGHPLLVSAFGVVAFAMLAAVGRSQRLSLLPWVALVGAAPCWLSLTLTGLGQSLERPSLSALWSAGGAGWALLAASVLLLLPIAAVRLDGEVARVCLAAAASLGVATACLPVVDEGLTAVTSTAVAVMVAGIVAGVSAPRRWLVVPLLPAGFASLPVIVTWVTMVGQGTSHVADVGAPFTAPADARLLSSDAIVHPVLVVPSALALLALAWLVIGPLGSSVLVRPAGAVVALSAVVSLTHTSAPLWSVVTATLVLAAAAIGRDLALAALLVGVAVGVGLASASLTVLTTAVLVLGCAGVLRLAASRSTALVAGLVLPAAIGGLLWSSCQVADVDQALRGVPATLVVGLLAVALHRREVEVSAAMTACLTSAVAVAEAANGAGSLALHLTLLGALVTSSALIHQDRRWAGWVGGSLLAAATWVRLADLGVGTPEAYTLPSALALLALGLHTPAPRPRDPDRSGAHGRTPPGNDTIAAVDPRRPDLLARGAARGRLSDPGPARQPAALERTSGHRRSCRWRARAARAGAVRSADAPVGGNRTGRHFADRRGRHLGAPSGQPQAGGGVPRPSSLRRSSVRGSGSQNASGMSSRPDGRRGVPSAV